MFSTQPRLHSHSTAGAWLPFLAARRFTLGRSFAVPVVDVVDSTDDAQWNDEESNDAEQQIRNCGLLVERHQLRVERQRRVSYRQSIAPVGVGSLCCPKDMGLATDIYLSFFAPKVLNSLGLKY